jgi:hypothetical protein
VYYPDLYGLFYVTLWYDSSMAPRSVRAIAEAKQRWLVIGRVTKIYYLALLRASEGTLSR